MEIWFDLILSIRLFREFKGSEKGFVGFGENGGVIVNKGFGFSESLKGKL